ncbi:hypothetical protein HMPREF9141_0714 [Prevotella multiformis DSM 16608]|uniref:Uncharacterized protein n=1 Tax=Prevotella multiformis DSM 16608 TaxID=888743 RepID=F0F548_9BACT|nr:hypothetical protein HMPREF9141_0714 [Prevotella multiformis DSM 16608]
MPETILLTGYFRVKYPKEAADVSVNGTLSVEQLCEIKTTENLQKS